MTFVEASNRIIETYPPVTATMFKDGVTLLMSYMSTGLVRDVNRTFGDVTIEMVPMSEVLGLFHHYIIKLAKEIGIEFTEDTVDYIIVQRLKFISDLEYLPEDILETSEETFARMFMIEFKTTMHEELEYLQDCDKAFGLFSTLEEKIDTNGLPDSNGFLRVYRRFNDLVGDFDLPPMLKSINNVEEISLDEMSKLIGWKNLSIDDVAKGVLLVTLMDVDSRNEPRKDRLNEISEFENVINEADYKRVVKAYERLVNEFHG